MKNLSKSGGFTIVETLVAAAVAGVVLAGAVGGVIALQRSFLGNKQYAAGMNNGSRLVDYVSRDLRNALRVSRRNASTVTSFKSGTFEIAGVDQLVLHVPDYYLSNIADNGSGSSFKTSRYSRSNLPSGQTYIP